MKEKTHEAGVTENDTDREQQILKNTRCFLHEAKVH